MHERAAGDLRDAVACVVAHADGVLQAGQAGGGDIDNLVAVAVVGIAAGDCAQGGGLLGLSQLAIGSVKSAGGDAGAVGPCAVGCLRCGVVRFQGCQGRAVGGVRDGVGELARSIAALEAHFLGDVALAVVEVARPDAAVFVGVAAPAVAVEVVPAVVGAAGGLAWMAWGGDCRYGFNSCLRTFYLGWRLV